MGCFGAGCTCCGRAGWLGNREGRSLADFETAELLRPGGGRMSRLRDCGRWAGGSRTRRSANVANVRGGNETTCSVGVFNGFRPSKP